MYPIASWSTEAVSVCTSPIYVTILIFILGTISKQNCSTVPFQRVKRVVAGLRFFHRASLSSVILLFCRRNPIINHIRNYRENKKQIQAVQFLSDLSVSGRRRLVRFRLLRVSLTGHGGRACALKQFLSQPISLFLAINPPESSIATTQ